MPTCRGSALLAAVLLLAGALGTAACRSAGSPRAATGSSSVLVLDRLSVSPRGMTAYEVVEQHRSHWLQRRGFSTMQDRQPIKVYLDGNTLPYGNAASLRELPASDVRAMEHLSGREAQARYGVGNAQGAIVVDTRSS